MSTAKLERCSRLIHQIHMVVYPEDHVQEFVWREIAVNEVVGHKFYEQGGLVFVQHSMRAPKDSTLIAFNVHLKQFDGAISEFPLNIVIK